MSKAVDPALYRERTADQSRVPKKMSDISFLAGRESSDTTDA
jgi:hypothetical protein